MKNADYVDSAYVDYDKIVIDNFLQNPSKGIEVGDMMAASYCFHEVTRQKPSMPMGMGLSRKKKKVKSRQSDQVPDDYPVENCYFWNYKTCTSNNCGRNHVCRICGDDHKAPACTHRKQ